MRTALLCLMLLALLVSGAMAQEENPNELLIHISPIAGECVGEAPMPCMVIRELPDGELSFFYDEIAGFDYEAGYEYQLRVNTSEVENPPADASSLAYELSEVVAQFPASFENRVWELQHFNETEVENGEEFTLIFNEDGTVAITTDCNEIMLSEYTLAPASIVVGGSTRMFCEGSIEAEYLAALNAINLWTIENGELLMTTDAGMLHFAPPNIDGKTWRVQSYESESLSWEDDGSADYTMNFDGEAVGLMIACNGGSGTVIRQGARIQLEEVISTLMACAEDPLMGLFPPMDFTYALNTEGQLILNTANGIFTLVEVSE